MKKEKIVLSFIAVLLGLLVAAVAFFIYQSTKVVPSSKIPIVTVKQPTTETSSIFLSIDSPLDQSVTKNKTLTITGKTIPEAILTLITDTDTQVVSPSRDGGYSLTTTLADGTNQIILTSIAPNGEEVKKMLTVTYSTEEF